VGEFDLSRPASAALLGHRDGWMTQRYAHLAPENLREAVAVFNGDYHKFISTRGAAGGAAMERSA